ncbi:MAG: hypothetical protein AAGF11_24685 [Myxococcota bacterium]
MRIWLTIPATIAMAGGLTLACTSSGGGVGAPCNVDGDCEGALICDEHDGQSSCQEPHDHGEETEEHGETEHEHDTGHEHDTEHEHDTGHQETEGHDSGSGTGEATTGSQTGTGDPTTGGVSAECETFCGCMTTNCGEFAAYPFADEAACATFCEDLTENEFTCFASFCEDAAVEPSMGLQEHWCEHAWGELGNKEC